MKLMLAKHCLVTAWPVILVTQAGPNACAYDGSHSCTTFLINMISSVSLWKRWGLILNQSKRPWCFKLFATVNVVHRLKLGPTSCPLLHPLWNFKSWELTGCAKPLLGILDLLCTSSVVPFESISSLFSFSVLFVPVKSSYLEFLHLPKPLTTIPTCILLFMGSINSEGFIRHLYSASVA